jgi:hypothetical protein
MRAHFLEISSFRDTFFTAYLEKEKKIEEPTDSFIHFVVYTVNVLKGLFTLAW